MTDMTPGSREIGADFLKAAENPGEQARMNYAELRTLMRQRFGEDAMDWCFVCPTDEPFNGCGLVQSARMLEAFGPAAKEQVGRICANYFAGRCRFTTLTARGGPLSVVLRLDIGVSLKPSLRIAPAGSNAGDIWRFGD